MKITLENKRNETKRYIKRRGSRESPAPRRRRKRKATPRRKGRSRASQKAKGGKQHRTTRARRGNSTTPKEEDGKAALPAAAANSTHTSLANSVRRADLHAHTLSLHLPCPAVRCVALPMLSCTIRLSRLPPPSGRALRCPALVLLLPCSCPAPALSCPVTSCSRSYHVPTLPPCEEVFPNLIC